MLVQRAIRHALYFFCMNAVESDLKKNKKRDVMLKLVDS